MRKPRSAPRTPAPPTSPRAADPLLQARIEGALPMHAISTKRMFGGLTYMLNNNMLCCLSSKGLMVRVGAAAEAEALARPFAARCLGAGREMPGFIMVEPEGLTTDGDLSLWLAMARRYVEALPPKPDKKRRA